MEKVIQDQESIESYIQHVFQRGEMLIQNKLWDGLNIVKYRG